MAIYWPDGNGGRKIINTGSGGITDASAITLEGFSAVAGTKGDIADSDNLLVALAKLQNRTVSGGSSRIAVAVPSQSGTLTYDGTEQTPTWLNFNTTKMTMLASSQNSATYGGVYTVYFSLLDGYEWEDGTISDKAVTWTINKLLSTLSFPNVTNDQADFIAHDTSSAARIETNSDGEITVTSSDPSVCSPIISSRTGEDLSDMWKVVQFNTLKAGRTDIIVSIAETEIYAAVSRTISVTVANKVIPIPKVRATSYTYSGSEMQAYRSFSDYNANYMTISGQTAATDAGTYTVTFSLLDGYEWEDGTTSDKTGQWTIVKRTPTMSGISDGATIKLTTSNPSHTYTVNTNGDGAVTAKSANPSVCSVSCEDNQVTVTGMTSGTTNVTVTLTETANYNAVSKTITVTVEF